MKIGGFPDGCCKSGGHRSRQKGLKRINGLLSRGVNLRPPITLQPEYRQCFLDQEHEQYKNIKDWIEFGSMFGNLGSLTALSR